MRVRNTTGVPQRIMGVTLPPRVWRGTPQDIPLAVAWEAVRCNKAEIALDGDESTLDRVLWMGPLSLGDGYGTANETMIWALRDAGMKVYPVACWFNVGDTDPETQKLLQEPFPGLMRTGVALSTPGEFHKILAPYKIGYTMYEADNPLEVYPEWRHQCAAVDRLWVPSMYCREVFGRFYKGPIDVQPLAINPVFCTGRQRVPSETFTFAMHGTLTARKSPLETIEAWGRAFPKDKYPHVRLELKTRLGIVGLGHNMPPTLDDDRITVLDGTWSREQMLDWLHRCDCFLFLSKGEGYGLPPREALASGMPTIVSANTGLLSMCDPDYVWPIPTAYKEPSILGGDWRIPDWDIAIDAMRDVVANPEAAYDKAVKGAMWYVREEGPTVVAAECRARLEWGGYKPTPKKEAAVPVNAAEHADFLNRCCAIDGNILDIGGNLALELRKRGKNVVAVVAPEDYREAVKRLPGIRVVADDPILLSNASHIDGCVSLGYLNNLSPDEIMRSLSAQRRLANKVLFSVPTVHHPQTVPGNKLWRMDRWRDTLSHYVIDMHYYNGRKHLWCEILKDRIGTAPKYGKMLDGGWYPRRGEV